MKLFFLIITLAFNLLSSSNLSANENISIDDLRTLQLDIVYLQDLEALEETYNQGMTIISYQNKQQEQIALTTEEFLLSDMTNEELWEILDSIYDDTDSYSEFLDQKTKSLKIETSSSNELAKTLYKEGIELLYELNSYSIENNKRTKDLIDSLAEGDIDKYDYLAGRGLVSNGKFLEIVSKRNFTVAKRLPPEQAIKHTLLIDAKAVDFISLATTINGFQVLGELNKSKFDQYKNSLESKYKTFKRGDSQKMLMDIINKIERDLDRITNEDDVEAVENTIKSITSYVSSLEKLVEVWNEVIQFYKENIDSLDSINTDESMYYMFDDILRRQSAIQEEVTSYALAYQAALLEYNRLLQKGLIDN